MKEIKIKALQGPYFKDTLSEENDIPYLIGYISAKDLVENHKIPYFSIKKGSTGYQRQPNKKRIAEYAKKIATSPLDFPTLVLLNLRNEKQINFYKFNK